MPVPSRFRTLALALFVVPGCLSAQTYITAGDNRLSLRQVLRFHPEGMVLSLPGAQGKSLSAAIDTALEAEPALALQLTGQELDSGLKAGREFLRLRGWSADLPHWALVGPDQRIYAEGTAAPTSTQLFEAYQQSPLHTRAQVLRDFLKVNSDHLEGLARLILETRALAERRTELALGPKSSADALEPTGAKEGTDPTKAPPPTKASEGNAPALLLEELDASIWGEYAALYQRFIREGIWLDAALDGAGPIPLAGELSSSAEHSPGLRALASQLLPTIEEQLRHHPSNEHRWQVWMSLRAAGATSRPSQVLAGLRPLPGALRWPPAAALVAFVEDARQRGDWREVEPILQASFDQTLELLRAMESAAREDANQGAQALGSNGSAGMQVQMGTYFGFGGWNSDVADLLEAKMRLGKLEEADKVFQALWSRVSKPATASSAAALARACGVDSLAQKWGQLAR